uniref:Uncharacterized protein n=1 Tax=Anguilla anguilla TaxID=7936 RepID=A0A0E9XA81_ANGAN
MFTEAIQVRLLNLGCYNGSALPGNITHIIGLQAQWHNRYITWPLKY